MFVYIKTKGSWKISFFYQDDTDWYLFHKFCLQNFIHTRCMRIYYNGTVVTVYGGSGVIYNVALLLFLRFISGTYPLGRKFKRQHCNIHMSPPLHSSERYALRCCVVDSAQSHVSTYYRSQTMSGIYARSFFFFNLPLLPTGQPVDLIP